MDGSFLSSVPLAIAELDEASVRGILQNQMFW